MYMSKKRKNNANGRASGKTLVFAPLFARALKQKAKIARTKGKQNKNKEIENDTGRNAPPFVTAKLN